jgi:hypothetical protein
LRSSAEIRISCLPKSSAEQRLRKNLFLIMEKQKHRIHERAGCQVPPVADWAKGPYSRRLITNCFGTGSEHKLNHL